MMARLAVIVTVTIFLFAFSHARSPLDLPENDVTFSKERSPLDLPENDVTVSDSSNILPESETMTTILLPSEKPESEPATVVEWEADTTEDKSRDSETTIAAESTEDLPVSETDTVTGDGVTQPLMFVNFHPVNRHFNRMHDKRLFPGRFPHRCRHHFKKGGPRFNGRQIPYGNDMILSKEGPRFNGRDIPYGNDMILSKEGPRFNAREIPHGNDMILSKDNAISDSTFQRGVPQIPARWIRFHEHGRPRFPHRHHEWNEEDVKRPHHHKHEREEMEKEREEREEGGFMRSFRKFLNHF